MMSTATRVQQTATTAGELEAELLDALRLLASARTEVDTLRARVRSLRSRHKTATKAHAAAVSADMKANR